MIDTEDYLKTGTDEILVLCIENAYKKSNATGTEVEDDKDV